MLNEAHPIQQNKREAWYNNHIFTNDPWSVKTQSLILANIDTCLQVKRVKKKKKKKKKTKNDKIKKNNYKLCFTLIIWFP